ncbi:HAD-IC family P-type ATPase [Methylogaea oryzae]|uniref:HAD-IC family P-type ATPase n=1 Tax=Methylogaea oryzae TaxID=1295382 RepID=UPI0006D00C14|nr:HAD-IC family P-type ATPase [Methylogaea oryzae]
MILEFLVLSGLAFGYNKKTQGTNELWPTAKPQQPDRGKPAADGLKKTKKLLKEVVEALSGSERNLQIQEISVDGEQPVSEFDQKINRHILLSSGITGTALLGATFVPALHIAGVGGVLYMAYPLYRKAYEDLKNKELTTYVTDAVIVSGVLATNHLVVAAMMALLGNVAMKMLTRLEDNSRKQLINVFGKQPGRVWVARDGVEVETPLESLQKGDIVVVNAGEVIAVDGVIKEGMASIDQHILTGEAQPVEKGVGDQVFAATAVLSGKLLIEVTKAGKDSLAAEIGNILNHTESYKDTLKARGQKIANDFNTPTLLLAALTWPTMGSEKALTVLFSGLGYNMRFLGTFSVLNYLHVISRQGVLIKDGRAFESMKNVDTIVFDKTGTLTLDQLEVGRLYPFGGLSEDALLAHAATAEHRQPHPVALAITAAAKERRLELPEIDEGAYSVGYGIKVRLNGGKREKFIRVGSARFLANEGIAMPDEVEAIRSQADACGYSLVHVAVDDRYSGAIELRPIIRPEAKAVIEELKKRDLQLYIISGDHEEPTRNLAEALGIDNYFAQTLPGDKAALVEGLRQQGRFVCFVGDGINDSIALKKANVSISLKGASTAATDTARSSSWTARSTS